MGGWFEVLSPSLMDWVKQQKMFWVSTAALASHGHVNVSPKGGPYFGLLDNKTFWYLELSGSGSETISHLYEPNNGRITVMFSAFDGAPRILRLYGHGTVLEWASPAFLDFTKKHDVRVVPGTRSIIVVDMHQCATSCGQSVPLYDFRDFRQDLNKLLQKMNDKFEKSGDDNDRVDRFLAMYNTKSMDGLPGMKHAVAWATEKQIKPQRKMVGQAASMAQQKRKFMFNVEHLVLCALSSAMAAVLLVLCVQRLAAGNGLLSHSGLSVY